MLSLEQSSPAAFGVKSEGRGYGRRRRGKSGISSRSVTR